MSSEIKLIIEAAMPVILSLIIYLIDKKTKFEKLEYRKKQIIIGIAFGIIAIIGTEWGIPMNGAQMNIRDAAVLSAGLMFGGPAGIIAGLIGGIERWFAVYWGVGYFTRVACSISTIAAGFYSAALRKFMFENKKPGFVMTGAIGTVMEIFHITMVFITNMNKPIEAMEAVKACTIPLVIANTVSVMLVSLAISIISHEHISFKIKKSDERISQTIQRWLFFTVVLAFLITSYFVFSLQTQLAAAQTDRTLSNNIKEVSDDIHDFSDQNLLSLTHTIAGEMEKGGNTIEEIADNHNVAEINIIDSKGIIKESSNKEYINFNMSAGEQSAEFLCLLDDKDEYVQQYQQISFNNKIMRKYAGVRYKDGFLQVGYNSEQFQKDINKQISYIAVNRNVGTTGFMLILDEELKVRSITKNAIQLTEIDRNSLPADIKESTTYTLTIGETEYYYQYIISEGYRIVSAIPVSEATETRNIALYVNTFMEILIFAVLFALIYMLIKRVVVDRIKAINLSLAKITGGNLDEVINVRTNSEFASLSDDINSTVETLKNYINEASARIDQELEFAKNIQFSALPNVFPAFPKRNDFDIHASMFTAKEVGGDFYDFYLTDENSLHFLIADVSGKGIPAAMFMMRAKTELKSLTETGIPINNVFTEGNRALCEGNDAGMFVTAWQGGIDLTTGKVTFANAGHNPPLIRRANGNFEFHRTRPGFVLAGMEGVIYKQQELQLNSGDTIFLYTDGVTEATNSSNELYGEDRLLNILNSREYSSMKEMCAAVKEDVDKFVGEAPQFDDITMLAVKYNGMPTLYFENSCIDDITKITAYMEEELEKIDCPMKTIMQLNVAVDEIYSNIVKYGYGDNGGPVKLQFILRNDPSTLFIRFADNGIPYNPLNFEEPDTTLSAEDRKIGGLGIFIVKKTMDDIKYKYENGQNILTIKKIIK